MKIAALFLLLGYIDKQPAYCHTLPHLWHKSTKNSLKANIKEYENKEDYHGTKYQYSILAKLA